MGILCTIFPLFFKQKIISKSKAKNKSEANAVKQKKNHMLPSYLKPFIGLPQYLQVKYQLITMGYKNLHGKRWNPSLPPWLYFIKLFIICETQQSSSFLLLGLEFCDPFHAGIFPWLFIRLILTLQVPALIPPSATRS